LKRILKFFVFVLILLLVIISIKTALFQSKQTGIRSDRRKFQIDTNAVNHLRQAIQIKSISYDNDSLTDYSQFDSLINFLESSYPLTFKKLESRIINKHSLLLHWKGSINNKKPVIFYAHLDVVPADSSSQWSHHPFAGHTDNEFIYGRGAIDDKGSIIAILESTEKLLKNNFIPGRDVYFAFGHDEEASGEKGARLIAETLEKEGVKAEFLLDEGGLVAVDMVPFVKPPVALVFTSEKGYMTLQLSVKSNGGHSSHPPAEAPIEIISTAIKSLHDHPFEKRMTQSVMDFMNYTGPEMKLPFKALFANQWLFKGIIFNEYEKISSANAMIRTTAVTTIIKGGEKENAIPSGVQAKINFRLLPGDNSEDIIQKVKSIINDNRVEVSAIGKIEEASTVSSVESEGFKMLRNSIEKIFPDAIISPSLLIAQTDSRHFRKVTENIYRFIPVRMNDKILDTMHGTDERIGINEFMEAIEFYLDFIGKL
jgi:carboxypeptidase PM20D1